MREPVTAADGFCYERAALEDWLRRRPGVADDQCAAAACAPVARPAPGRHCGAPGHKRRLKARLCHLHLGGCSAPLACFCQAPPTHVTESARLLASGMRRS